jgi:amidophosphoribosyltransferase
VASESCALDAIGARFVRDIKPGEILFIDHREVVSEQLLPPQPAYCMFEYVYFARPDSMVNGQSVYKVRKNLGINLAREHPTIADAVVPIPDSGNYAAIGFSESSKIPLEMGYIRSHYIGRTFIQPSQEKRNLGVELKLRAIKDAIEGKRVVVIDDSIVRGTTARLRSKILKSAGARELHLRISCPPLRFPCIYGIDFPTKEELIASSKSVEEIKRFISGEDLFGGIETLGYLSLDGLLKSIQLSPKHICTACWTGNYPVVPDRKVDKFIFEK